MSVELLQVAMSLFVSPQPLHTISYHTFACLWDKILSQWSFNLSFNLIPLLIRMATFCEIRSCLFFFILSKSCVNVLRLFYSGGSDGKESACNAGDSGSIPWSGRSPGEGNGYPLQYSCLENPMDCRVHGVTKSWTQLSDFHFPPGKPSGYLCLCIWMQLSRWLSLSFSLSFCM